MDPQRVVVPIDTSSHGAERGVPAAIAAARLFGCGVELLQFVEDRHEVSRLQHDLELVRSSIRLAAPDVAVHASTAVEPNAPDGIIAAIEPAYLPVIATRAAVISLRHYVGSAARRVVAESGRPALLVGPAADADRALDVDSVLVTVDPDSPDLAVIDLAHYWASKLGVRLVVLAVIPNDADPSPAQRLLDDGVAHLWADADGPEVRIVWAPDPAAAICALGSTALIVMNSHARSGIKRIAMGSVTTAVLRHAERPVLVALIDEAAEPATADEMAPPSPALS